MLNINRIKYDVRYYFKQNKFSYYFNLFCFLFGIIIAGIVAFSGESYVGLLLSKNKILINIINGTISYSAFTFDCFLSFILPMIFIFVTSLNFYLSYFNYFIIAYQGTILTLSIFALIYSYGFVGIIKAVCLVLPINLIYIFILIYFCVECRKRSRFANKYKKIFYGFNNVFFNKILVVFIIILALSIFVGFVFPILLKSAIFFIF